MCTGHPIVYRECGCCYGNSYTRCNRLARVAQPRLVVDIDERLALLFTGKEIDRFVRRSCILMVGEGYVGKGGTGERIELSCWTGKGNRDLLWR